MDKVLPILIDTAEGVRDRLAAQARETAQQVAQSLATLERLEQFRQDMLQRSPAGLGRSASPQTLQDYQRFIARLDEAILMQKAECERRLQRDVASKAQLAEGQRKLMAFETLAKRRAAAREHKANQAAQRAADEFAARAVRAAQQNRDHP